MDEGSGRDGVDELAETRKSLFCHFGHIWEAREWRLTEENESVHERFVVLFCFV